MKKGKKKVIEVIEGYISMGEPGHIDHTAMSFGHLCYGMPIIYKACLNPGVFRKCRITIEELPCKT